MPKWEPDTYGIVTYVKVMPPPMPSTLELRFVDPRTGERKEEIFPCARGTAYRYVEGDQVGITLVGVRFLPGNAAQWMLTEELK